MKYLIIILSVCFSAFSVSADITNKVLADALGIQKKEYPFLGMNVLSVENDKHVLISKNGRYLIKGTLQDLWVGVKSPFVEQNPVNYKEAKEIFKLIKKEDLAITLGNPKGKSIDVFVSYSCVQCELLVKQIMKKDFLNEHKINLFVVYANELDKKIALDLFCSDNTIEALKKRYLERDISDLDHSCSAFNPKMSIMYANLLLVRSLPATLSSQKVLHYGVLPKKF